MSVVGFDIGNYKSSVGIARAGGIEIVANEYSDRITPTCVSYTNNERHQGHSAKQQEVTNSHNTISCFKRLLGRKANDPQIQNERNYQPMRLAPTQSPDDKIHFNVDYLNETKSFTVEQITGTFLTKLKTIAETNLNSKVVDCVISVPCYMTDAERRALIDASQVAGLNCLKLMNETTAVALTYGLYHTNLPDVNEKPHIVAFVDMGHTHLQVSAVAFNKGKLRMLATTFDNNLGGRDFDRVLIEHFAQDFKQRYHVDAMSNVRARLRLRNECEKLKKLMSSNASPIPLNIECFMNDTDVSGKMKREDFEKLSESLLARVRRTLEELLHEAKLTPKDIDLIEIVGGSTRIPAIKQIVHEVFAKEPSTTLNADEACARGCTIMCAILSPNFKVKEFKIEDCQLFPITLSWKGAETDDNELEVFPKFEKIPLSKLLTIYKREPFEIEARYRFPNNIPFNEPRIGKFHIGNVGPNAQGENSEIKLKARITKNGIFEISSPQVIETVEVEVNTAAPTAQSDQQPAQPNEQQQQQQNEPTLGERQDSQVDNENAEESTMNEDPATAANANGDGQPANQQQQQQQKTLKKKTKAIDLPLTAKVPQLTKTELNNLLEQELFMIQQDRKEKERSEAKNSVEEYIYEIREKLSSEYERFILPEHKDSFERLLDETESWLYSEQAENQEKNVYIDRLQHLKKSCDKILSKYPYTVRSTSHKSNHNHHHHHLHVNSQPTSTSTARPKSNSTANKPPPPKLYPHSNVPASDYQFPPLHQLYPSNDFSLMDDALRRINNDLYDFSKLSHSGSSNKSASNNNNNNNISSSKKQQPSGADITFNTAHNASNPNNTSAGSNCCFPSASIPSSLNNAYGTLSSSTQPGANLSKSSAGPYGGFNNSNPYYPMCDFSRYAYSTPNDCNQLLMTPQIQDFNNYVHQFNQQQQNQTGQYFPGPYCNQKRFF